MNKEKIQVRIPEAHAWQAQVYLLQTAENQMDQKKEDTGKVPMEIKDEVTPLV